MTANPWLGILAVLAVLGGLMGGLRLVQRRFSPHPELVRKLFHVGAGMTTLPLPWIFTEVWPVLTLSAVAIGGLLAMRHVRELKQGLGGILGGVARQSLGEMYFVLSVCLLFVLAHGEPILYVMPLLILTWADALAALVGVAYGRISYSTADGRKSAEGSLAFFLVAFFSVHVPLLLFTGTGRQETLLISTTVGLLVMMFEAVAWHGLDNLFVPLASFLLLRASLTMDDTELAARLAVAALLTVLGLILRKQTTLSASALLGSVLVGFLAWAVGGWQWLLVPLIVFVAYILSAPKEDRAALGIQQVNVVLSVSGAGLMWLLLAEGLDRPGLFLPYTISFAAHLAISGAVFERHRAPASPAAAVLGRNIARGWALLFVPFALIGGLSLSTAIPALWGLPGIAVAVLTFAGWQPAYDLGALGPARWRRQAVCSGIGSLVGLLPLYLW